MAVKTIFIVRHGETDYNAAHRWQGHLDVQLNAIGRFQAQQLANYLKTEGIIPDTIYSSDLSRALDTARIVAQIAHIRIHKEPRLREINVGIFQGMTRQEMSQVAPDSLDQWDTDDSFVISNGESRLMLQERAYAAWKDIIERKDHETVMIFTHGGTIRMLLRKILPPEQLLDLRVPNTSLTILERLPGGKLSSIKIGATPHLNPVS